MQITSVLTFGNFYLIHLLIAILLCPVTKSQNLLRDTGSRNFESMFEDKILSIARRLLVSRFTAFEQEMLNQLQVVKQEIVKNKFENDAAVMKLSQSVQNLSLRVNQIITESNSNREHIKSSTNQYHNISITIRNEMSVLRDNVTATNSNMLDKIANLQKQMDETAENVNINRNKTDEISFKNRKLHVMIEETDSKLLKTDAQIANKFQDQQQNTSIQLNGIRSDLSALRNSTNSSEKAVFKNIEKLTISLKELPNFFSITNKLEHNVSVLQSEMKGLSKKMSNKIADMQVHMGEITENVTINRNKTDQISVENRKLHIKIQETNSKLLNTEAKIENKFQDLEFNASLQLNAIRSDVSVLRNATETSEKNEMIEKIEKLAISLNELTQNFSSTVTIENDLSFLQSNVKTLNINMSDKIANVQMNISEIIENVTMNRNKTNQLSVENGKLHMKIQETDSKLLNTEIEIENKFQEHELNASLYMNALQSEMYALRKTTNYTEKVMLENFDNLTASLHELIQNFSLTKGNVELLLKVQTRQGRKINNITKQQIVFETAIQKLANDSRYFSDDYQTTEMSTSMTTSESSTNSYETTEMSTHMTTLAFSTMFAINEPFCTFEPQDDCFLENSTKDDFDWTRRTGGTPSSDTGPSSASGGLYYSYIEVSDPRKTGDTASLVSKEFISGGQKCLQFDYHMRGDHMGTFKVFTFKENTANEVFSRSGEQGNDWNSAAIPLTSVESYKLRFDGIKGSDFKGDIAIDNIRILQGNCARHNIRLVGGSSTREGRIEVYIQGKWGTVCDDSFGNTDGLVVCKTLGFNRVISVKTQAFFGQGTGSIVMDEVACSGSESSIFECSYSSSHDCSHSEDVGVKCD